jgi:hypothetical protein
MKIIQIHGVIKNQEFIRKMLLRIQCLKLKNGHNLLRVGKMIISLGVWILR